MRLSVRNQLKGTIVSVTRGPITALVKVELGGGQYVTATLTTEAADDLELTEGAEVTAMFKASAVILGVE
ncbi:MAG: TOBE domain-containing protein [Coriobacteriia bacterium]|nr:TOBE domain-containing protein [Coriobacteriia bacterium]